MAFVNKNYDRLREHLSSQYHPLNVYVLVALSLWFIIGISAGLLSFLFANCKELLTALVPRLLGMLGWLKLQSRQTDGSY